MHALTSESMFVYIRTRSNDDSPDLNPPDFYLWGYLKDNMYENNTQTIGELKAAITTKFREIT
jgi:hypothetical protein